MRYPGLRPCTPAALVAFAGAIGSTTAAGQSPPVHTDSLERARVSRGYLRTQAVLRARRAWNVTAANAALSPTVFGGRRSVPVLCVKFKGEQDPYPANEVSTLLFDPPPSTMPAGRHSRTMTRFYRDVSQGHLVVDGTVDGWIQLSESDTYYESTDLRFGELLKEGLTSADQRIDFGRFDNDGPDGRPNSGDDDGVVDTVFFVHSQQDGACGGAAAGNIGSHFWQYSQSVYGHGAPFVTGDDRLGTDGRPVIGADGRPQRIRIDDYAIHPAFDCSTPTDPRPRVDIGVFCHEYAHAMGLPDLYDRTPSTPDSAGLGYWCLLAYGSFGGDGEHTDWPTDMSAWCKARVGWVNPTRITTSGTYRIEPVQEAGQMYRLDLDATGDEYLLVEYRSSTWTDTRFGCRVNWDAHLPASGLAIWHVDERVGRGDPDWPCTDVGQGQNDAASTPGSAEHALVALEQADLKLSLENNVDNGDAGDLWKDGAKFGSDQKAGAWTYAGKDSGIRIDQIRLANGTFRVTGLAPAPPQAPVVASASMQPRHAAPSVFQSDSIVNLAQAALSDGGASLGDAVIAQLRANVSGWAGAVGDVDRHRLLTAIGLEVTTKADAIQAFGPTIGSCVDERSNEPLELLMDPTIGRVIAASGLRMEIDRSSAERLEQSLFDLPTSALYADGVDLRVTPLNGAARTVDLEQIVEVDGEVLPVLGRRVRIVLDGEGRTATGFSSSAAPFSLDRLDSGERPADDDVLRVARGVVSQGAVQLGRRGIRAHSGGSPQLVREVLLPLGGDLEPVRILVRESDLRIVSID